MTDLSSGALPQKEPSPARSCGCVVASIGKRRVYISFGGSVYRIKAEGAAKGYTFEWDERFGPSRCHSVTGELLADPFFSEHSPFWPLFDRWTAGGRKVDEFGRCVLAPVSSPSHSDSRTDGRRVEQVAGDETP